VEKGKSQFRVHFPIGTDYDWYSDRIAFRSDSNVSRRPKLIVQYQIEPLQITEDRNYFSEEFRLLENYPNPFNLSTKIKFELRLSGNYKITILNIMGTEVSVLHTGFLNIGHHYLNWNGKNKNGDMMPSGIYLYKIQGDNTQETRKMILLQ
tara:strand:+ start:107 stop:559 length:453 start_codon:yes stop_codon:yes gene_type:complete